MENEKGNGKEIGNGREMKGNGNEIGNGKETERKWKGNKK
jgi:hypothetical protein